MAVWTSAGRVPDSQLRASPTVAPPWTVSTHLGLPGPLPLPSWLVRSKRTCPRNGSRRVCPRETQVKAGLSKGYLKRVRSLVGPCCVGLPSTHPLLWGSTFPQILSSCAWMQPIHPQLKRWSGDPGPASQPIHPPSHLIG